MSQLLTFSNLKQNGAFKQLDYSLIESLKSLGNNEEISTSNIRWYYNNEDDEMEMYGFDEMNELEMNHQKFLNGKIKPVQEITAGYFANCDSKHYIDYLNLSQFNADSKRDIIRAVSNNELNNKFVQINSFKNMNHNDGSLNIKQPKYCELQRNILKQEHCGGDAIEINMNFPSFINSIINNTLYVQCKQYDIPIASMVINKDKPDQQLYYQQVDNMLESFINSHGSSMDIIKLYHQCNLKVNSSMISYLISEEKCNLIIYDTDFQLIAVGKYKGQYIHDYNKENEVNPYQYSSFIDFHLLLSSFYELSLMDSNCLTINSLISCFNKHIRACLIYKKYMTLWTPSINNTQIFQHIMQQKVVSIPDDIDNKYMVNIENIDGSDDDDEEEEESDIDDAYQSESNSSTESVIDDYFSDCSEESTESLQSLQSIQSVESVPNLEYIECSICYENVINSAQYHHHNDVCHSCLEQWRKNGHHNCPICGANHIQ